MRRTLSCLSLVSLSIFASFSNYAQSDRFAYAITDLEGRTSSWQYLRKLDLRTGEYSQVVLDGSDINAIAFSASSRKQLTEPVVDARMGNAANAPFGTGVAAMAYDKKNNRLYYTPMFVDQLRYVDLRTMRVFYLTETPLTNMPAKSPDQGNIVTRMVVASDGNGYALTNDGMHLIRFSTGRKLDIVNLGSLVDDPANKTSVHNSCSSYGGDMIADDNGNIYVFSARNNVFRVNIESRVATHLGQVSGLPNNFTINGAAVNDRNQILVASAVATTSYYTVDPSNWSATPFQVPGTVWHSSDLANSNLLVTNQSPGPTPELITANSATLGSNQVQIYPNPVTNNRFLVQFHQLPEGTYTISVTDVMGRQVLQQAVPVTSDNQSQSIGLDGSTAKGFYLVKVTDESSRVLFSTKLVLQ